MFNYLLISEIEDFTQEDISSLLCEAQKFGTISFILFRSLDQYSRNSSEKFRIREYLNKVRHELNKNISLSEEDYYAYFHD